MSKIPVRRIKVTGECNQNCIFCNSALAADSDRKIYSDAYIRRQILDRNNAVQLNITGGEPTLNRRLGEFIKLAKKTGYKRITVLTNGINFSDKEYTLELKEDGLTEAVVSLNHFDPLISDKISRTEGSFAKKIKGIRNLLNTGIAVTVNIVIFSLNASALEKLVKYLSLKLSVNSFAFSVLEPNCTRVMQNPGLIPGIKNVLSYLKKTVNYCKRKRINYYIPYNGAIPACIFGKYNIAINKPEDIIGTDFDTNNYVHFSFCARCSENRTCMGFFRQYAGQCVNILYGNYKVK